jgi:hypothetical protein
VGTLAWPIRWAPEQLLTLTDEHAELLAMVPMGAERARAGGHQQQVVAP